MSISEVVYTPHEVTEEIKDLCLDVVEDTLELTLDKEGRLLTPELRIGLREFETYRLSSMMVVLFRYEYSVHAVVARYSSKDKTIKVRRHTIAFPGGTESMDAVRSRIILSILTEESPIHCLEFGSTYFKMLSSIMSDMMMRSVDGETTHTAYYRKRMFSIGENVLTIRKEDRIIYMSPGLGRLQKTLFRD